MKNHHSELPAHPDFDHRRTTRGQGDRHAAHAPSQPNLQACQEGKSQGWRADGADRGVKNKTFHFSKFII